MSSSPTCPWRRWPNSRRGVEEGSLHPKPVKQRLAREIVARFYGAEKAAGAEAHFERVVTAGEIPDDVPEHRILPDQLQDGAIWIVRLLVDAGLAPSNGEARRLISQGGVKIDGEPVTDASLDWPVQDGAVVQVGQAEVRPGPLG